MSDATDGFTAADYTAAMEIAEMVRDGYTLHSLARKLAGLRASASPSVPSSTASSTEEAHIVAEKYALMELTKWPHGPEPTPLIAAQNVAIILARAFLQKEADRQYHMNAINRLAAAIGKLGCTSDEVVSAVVSARASSPDSVPVSVLREHWLHAIECDHEKKMDRPICSCSLQDLGWHPSIGAAVETWLKHVQGVSNG